MNHALPRPAAALAALALLAAPALGQWSSDPLENLGVVTAPGGQELPKVASAPDNSTWVSWFDNRTGSYQVRIQRLDAAGNRIFGADGLLVSANPQSTSLVDYDLIADAAGNAVLVFTDTRSDFNRDVYAYLISPAGEFLWGDDGLTLSDNSDFEADPRVVQASDGEYVFLWPRLDSSDPGLYMQRVNALGAAFLDEGGQLVAGNGIEEPAFCEMVASNSGSVIAVWARDTRTFSSPRHLHAQKFDFNANPLWATDPVVVQPTPIPIAHRPRIISDGGSGAIIAWHDSRLSNVFNCWVQRLDNAGQLLFPAGGVQSSTNNVDRQHLDPAIAFSPISNSTFIFWNQRNGAQSQWGVTGQRIGPTGTRMWGDEGVPWVPMIAINRGFIRAVPVPGGDVMVFYLDYPGTPSLSSWVRGMRITPGGISVWPSSPIMVSSLASVKGRLPVAVDPTTGMAKLVWEDQRNGNNDVYAQNVNPDGTLGAGGAPCPADWNEDELVNSGDISAFLTAWLDSVQNGNLNADFNGDMAVNSGDISAFLTAWLDAVQNGC